MAAKSKQTRVPPAAGAALPTMQLAILACLLAILGSALGVVVLAQHSRLLFAELETLRKQQDQLDTQWSRLILQRSTLLSPANVERVARRQLAMLRPPTHEVVVIRP